MENFPLQRNNNYNQIKKDNINHILSNNDLDSDSSSQENNINENNNILNIIKNRFNNKIYFTNVKNDLILIYINSFCNEEEIFGNDIKYLFKLNDNLIENGINIDSHLFKSINNALLDLKKNNINKYTILLQGDSYSGKSKLINEGIKYIINMLKTNYEYLTETKDAFNIFENLQSSATNKQFGTMSFEDGFYSIDNNKYNLINLPKKILASLNILEAFCNSKNDINDNCTRSINYIKIRFNKKCNKILGMEILPFLFDKNRVSNLDKYTGYNFNIFYYLLNCNDDDFLNKLFLSEENINNYIYLKRTNKSLDKDEISFNEIKFNELKESLNIVGFNNEEILTIFKILASIILLGNVELEHEKNFKSSLNKNKILLNVCDLLNIDINEFVSALVNQESFEFNIYNNETLEIEQTKNNFVNELYNQLFLWIINKINNNINNNIITENEKDKFFIFLDYPGFEHDQTNFNFLEQLYINYINELIYFFYTKDCLNETSNINIKNKKDILSTINYLLTELKNIQNEKQFKIFISNFIKEINSNKNKKNKYPKISGGISLILNSSSQNCFLIKHTSNDVLYNINDILIKNIKNFIPWNLLDCILKSKDPNIRNIYKNNNRKNIISNKTYENIFNNFNNSYITLSEEFINYIKEIKQEIKQSTRKYIICLKSNPNDDPLEFDDDYIFNKLKFYKISSNEFIKQQLENKNEKKIIEIQSGIKSFIEKNKFKSLNDIYHLIQNSLRIMKAKKELNNIKTKKIFLLIQLEFFLHKIKKKEKKEKKEINTNKNGGEINIINNNKKKYINIQNEEEKNQDEEIINIINIKAKKIPKEKDKRLTVLNAAESNILVQKINKMNKSKNKTEQINNSKIQNNIQIINIFQQKFFLKKIKQKKISTKKIMNFAHAQLCSKYYTQLKKEIIIIQKYFKKYITSQKILEKAFDNYIKKKYTKSNNDLNKKINDILFPYRIDNLNDVEKILTIEQKNISNNNISDNNKKNKNKYIMSTAERYKEYKKKNQYFNFKNNNINSENNKNNLNQQSQQRNIKKGSNKNFIETYQTNKDILIKNIPNLNNHGKHYENKIYLLSKIIDIDILTEIPNDEKYNELLWVKEYKKIYEFNLKNKTPIQQIFLSDTHTVLINNLGKIFLYGSIYNNNYISANDFLKGKNDTLYENVKEAVLKDGFTLILNKKGKAFTLNENYCNYNYNYNDNNIGGELNTSTYNNENPQINIQNKTQKINNQIILSKIQSIQGCGNLNLFLTKSNEVYLDINNQLNPFKLFIPNKIRISSISCGYNFYILLSNIGKVYSGGSNTFGELCSKSYIKQRMSPEEISEVSNLKENIIQISCGFKHVIILSEKNNVYGWGNNSFGQLFSLEKKKRLDLIKLNSDKKILQISCGFRSSFLLDEKNEIYYFGVLNKEKKNTTNKMERIYLEEKNNEYGNKNEFIPVKINSKWNKQFSLLYIHFADIRNISVKIEDQNHKYQIDKIKYIINILTSKWLLNSIKVPFIQELKQYFTEDYMEQPDKINKIKQEIFY